MYIPLTYWESQGATLAQSSVNYYVPLGGTVPTTISYAYKGNVFNSTFTSKGPINKICQDTVTQNSFTGQSTLGIASLPYFCSATITGSSTCCIQTPPNTGPEAWYIDVIYSSGFADSGTFYFYYINEKGEVTNDTITYAEGTKRIISQTSAMWRKTSPLITGQYLSWNIISKFPGQVIPYKYMNLPVKYEFTLKRGNYGSGNNFNLYLFQTTGSLGLNADFTGGNGGNIGDTLQVSSYNIPMPTDVFYQNPPCTWVTGVTPIIFTRYNLQSCTTADNLWVTLTDLNASYVTGSVLGVSNTELTSTSSCWTINSITSSASQSVSLTGVDVIQSYSASYCDYCLGERLVVTTGGISGSFTSGSTLYGYNSFTSSGTFSITSGSITDGKIMVIAGGGGGGAEGGGGAGGLVYSSSLSMGIGSYAVNIGTGGAAYSGVSFNQNAANGTDSTFSGSGFNIIAIGGGKGASYTSGVSTNNGGDGGSGGGGNIGGSPGAGTSGQGNNGGAAGTVGGIIRSGGGGGAGSSGAANSAGSGRQLGSVMVNVSASYSAGGALAAQGISTTSGSGGRGGGGATAGQTGLNGLVVITYPIFIP